MKYTSQLDKFTKEFETKSVKQLLSFLAEDLLIYKEMYGKMQNHPGVVVHLSMMYKEAGLIARNQRFSPELRDLITYSGLKGHSEFLYFYLSSVNTIKVLLDKDPSYEIKKEIGSIIPSFFGYTERKLLEEANLNSMTFEDRMGFVDLMGRIRNHKNFINYEEAYQNMGLMSIRLLLNIERRVMSEYILDSIHPTIAQCRELHRNTYSNYSYDEVLEPINHHYTVQLPNLIKTLVSKKIADIIKFGTESSLLYKQQSEKNIFSYHKSCNNELKQMFASLFMEKMKDVTTSSQVIETVTPAFALYTNAMIHASVDAATALKPYLPQVSAIAWLDEMKIYDISTIPSMSHYKNHMLFKRGSSFVSLSYILYFISTSLSEMADNEFRYEKINMKSLIKHLVVIYGLMKVHRKYFGGPFDWLMHPITFETFAIESSLVSKIYKLYESYIEAFPDIEDKKVELDEKDQDVFVDAVVQSDNDVADLNESFYDSSPWSHEQILRYALQKCQSELYSHIHTSTFNKSPGKLKIKEFITNMEVRGKPNTFTNYFSESGDFNEKAYRTDFFKAFIDISLKHPCEQLTNAWQSYVMKMHSDEDADIQRYWNDQYLAFKNPDAATHKPLLVKHNKVNDNPKKEQKLKLPKWETVFPVPVEPKPMAPITEHVGSGSKSAPLMEFLMGDTTRDDVVALFKDMIQIASAYMNDKNEHTLFSLKYDVIRILEALKSLKLIASPYYNAIISERVSITELRNAIVHHDITLDDAQRMAFYTGIMDGLSSLSYLAPRNELDDYLGGVSAQIQHYKREGSSNGLFPIELNADINQLYVDSALKMQKLNGLLTSIHQYSIQYEQGNIPDNLKDAERRRKEFIMMIAEASEIYSNLGDQRSGLHHINKDMIQHFKNVRNTFKHHNVIASLDKVNNGDIINGIKYGISKETKPDNLDAIRDSLAYIVTYKGSIYQTKQKDAAKKLSLC